MKTVYSYTDHRLFLKDWFLEQKRGPAGFSYEKFSRLAGLASPNYMKLVIEGKRNLTVSNIHQVARALVLDFDETQYFEALTLLRQGKTDCEAKYFKNRLRTLRRTKPTASVKVSQMDLLGLWYFPVVVVALDKCPITNALQIIAKKTGLRTAEIDGVLQILANKQMLREEDGIYRVDFNHFIVHDAKARSKTSHQYLREQMRITAHLLEKKYSQGPKFIAHTFAISKGAFSDYVGRIDSFIETLTAESDNESPDEIVQLNIQFFNLLDVHRENGS